MNTEKFEEFVNQFFKVGGTGDKLVAKWFYDEYKWVPTDNLQTPHGNISKHLDAKMNKDQYNKLRYAGITVGVSNIMNPDEALYYLNNIDADINYIVKFIATYLELFLIQFKKGGIDVSNFDKVERQILSPISKLFEKYDMIGSDIKGFGTSSMKPKPNIDKMRDEYIKIFNDFEKQRLKSEKSNDYIKRLSTNFDIWKGRISKK